MTKTLTISISEERLDQLAKLADEAGLSAEELLSASIEEWLKSPRQDFQQAAKYVMQKNAELYRRLA